MKIVLKSRANLFSKPGGDTMQIQATADSLKKLGIEANVSTRIKENLANYDLVHLFNITPIHETYLQYLEARRQNKKVVITPIYQNFDEWDAKGRIGMQKIFFNLLKNKNHKELLKTAIRTLTGKSSRKSFIAQAKMGFVAQQKEVLNGSDLIITNTELEMQQLKKDLGINNQYSVSHLGIDTDEFQNVSDIFYKKFKLKDYVLCVANFASIKNHLNLIEAVKNTGWLLVLIGNPVPHHRAYFNKIKSKANKNLKIFTGLNRKEVISAYKYARVHILASWFETCGLANMEAGLAGCNLVSTNRGFAQEYYKNYIEYCSPDNVDSIKNAIVQAYDRPKNDSLKNYLLDNFSWEKSTKKILAAYSSAINL